MEKNQSMENKICFCDTGLLFENCCGLYLQKNQKAPAALALMRSRYSAYASHNADYLIETTYISERKYYSKTEILRWAQENKWQKLEILSFTENTVEFKASFAKLSIPGRHFLSKISNRTAIFYLQKRIF